MRVLQKRHIRYLLGSLVADEGEGMKVFGITIHVGDCIHEPIFIYRDGVDRRSAEEIALDAGHTEECERVTHPHSLHPCNCDGL